MTSVPPIPTDSGLPRAQPPPHAPAGADDAAWRGRIRAGDAPGADGPGYAAFMLGKVSRTFALNIRVLPSQLRYQVLLAYLFCRMADTLEDDADLPAEGKPRLLAAFAALFPGDAPPDAAAAAAFAAGLPADWAGGPRWDRSLVRRCEWIFAEYARLRPPARAAIAACVREMCGGMAEFSARRARGERLIGSWSDLDRYCYYVAGTVGLLLCDLFALHSPLIGPRRAARLREKAVSFGLGLQLTNILKDIAEDKARDVSFLPPEALGPGADGRASLSRMVSKALGHLEDALDYTCRLPRLEPRLRLFCLWPLFMALESLVVVAEVQDALRPRPYVKISRRQVAAIIRTTSLACGSNLLLRHLFARGRRRLERGLRALTKET